MSESILSDSEPSKPFGHTFDDPSLSRKIDLAQAILESAFEKIKGLKLDLRFNANGSGTTCYKLQLGKIKFIQLKDK